MVILTSQEIARYRSELADFPKALEALDMIEDCEGNIEDAAISLALHLGQEPNISENWLESLAKRCRVAICHKSLRNDLLEGSIKTTIEYLVEQKLCPTILATPVALYVVKQNINEFCQVLDAQFS